jgi:hypothetical protein
MTFVEEVSCLFEHVTAFILAAGLGCVVAIRFCAQVPLETNSSVLWIILGTTIAVAVAVVLLPFLFPSCNVIFIALLSFAGLLALFRDPVSDLMYQRFGR